MILIGSINNQPNIETEFTIYPEDITTPGATTIFKDIDSNAEKFYGAYYFGASSTSIKDARSGLIFSSIDNVNLY